MPEFELQPTANEDAAFKVWVNAPSQNPTHLGRRGARLKLGKKVCKTAVFSQFGDQGTGEVKRRELRLCAYERQPDGTFAFDSPDVNWYIVDEEIEQLLAFLNSDVDQPGRYRVIDTGSPAGTLLEVLDGRPKDDTLNRPGSHVCSLGWFLMPHRAETGEGSRRLRTRPG